MSPFRVVEKGNPLAVHCLAMTEQRGRDWIAAVDLNIMADKSLQRDSFKIQQKVAGAWRDVPTWRTPSG